MNAIMLVFALSFGGQAGTVAIAYESMAACEAAKGDVLVSISEQEAVVCTKPVKVLVI